ncbi:heme A synthase [Salipiger aestuarii]|uniref:Heme A synthase n=1 Tax=Salipiger aestuarii TaxID=568098 RepID=A0A327Y583_9RHOB|nr:heme A synthase [Salipiger aestuarii]EIE51984.1 cytochrome oxidase assembly [Citreicella sp. 357]KAA8606340.1 heme A synthase [Salipiger aestuarii]KAA8610628.1 heme A synthase [Salipiger aestuarii]KAB2541642.1 heme A synthase [Salipiger aestuarii]RAK14905.1 cytochrome c oxidase assembly protein subunit 15 [Salipiger aestuarii]
MAEKRKLFEEVGTEQPRVAPAGGMIDRKQGGARGAIRIWLMVIFALVAVMILVGGLTRLTDAGLSITEWKPLTGALPPMNAADWEAEFDLYRQIPEFELQNDQMTLAEFKGIYWWEWGHRQLGRVIGLVWAVGFVGFLVARKVPTGWVPRLLGLGALGGLQGAIGWWMVSSGLDGDMLDVASYRLAIHLGLAFVIFGLIAWYVFALGRPERELMQARRVREAKLFSMGTGLMHFAFLQILLGALVAGIDAGRSYTDWPLMAGGFIPPQPFQLAPWWRNFFEEPGLVQFMHRMAGYLLFAFGVATWLRARKSPNPDTRLRFNAVMAMLTVQVVLGIVTVLYGAQLHIAITHQLGAVLLWVLIVRARFGAQYPKVQSIRGRLK